MMQSKIIQKMIVNTFVFFAKVLSLYFSKVLTFTLQPSNDWSMAPASEPEQNGAAVTPQLMDAAPKAQDDTRQLNTLT